MSRYLLIALAGALTGLCSAAASAALDGGGSYLMQGFYNTPGVLPSTAGAYRAAGSGAGKKALLINDSQALTPGSSVPFSVDYAISESRLTVNELAEYRSNHQVPGAVAGSAADWGPLIQVPVAITSVAIPYRVRLASGQPVTDLDLNGGMLCGLFSGAITTWDQINPAYSRTPVKVIYRADRAGTSEILTRHLNSLCPQAFNIGNLFVSAHRGPLPGHWQAVSSDQALLAGVAANEGAIGYSGPAALDITSNAQVARVNGLLPPTTSTPISLTQIAPPATAVDRADPHKWAPDIANPAFGYAMVGYSYLIFSQCYRDPQDAAALRIFLVRHFSPSAQTNNDTRLIAQHLIPLDAVWKRAVRDNFLLTTSLLSLNNPNVCNGIGRPL
ncbi:MULTISPECIES: substrate-binding domain-containing protein [Pseudomonas]|uniref:substrate-binding domain-containing protein n=1 Tax=Pseudomonas TaxID=286 RepID=UPI000C88B7DE|nr:MULTISPECIES: substrate-binding domain-containing protein [Pseudomonas]AZC50501.1 Phosphate-binding DING protein [Pseudomonas chlororaphis subsp. piscium]AZC57077.1 Phosphate-binding DING protein [Pseudomonas chlororaphis subsp. piscium]AZC75710.1 Phosphate-binding DING protein [Pseudomonas chlororaphis subsp. piscium]MBP5059152.1 substrate-binding domain-containing protein [Pseudomonas chlororaphis]MBP5141216.1 substrate-binding domain-containing protein [Pseudomonas chlororaphis]